MRKIIISLGLLGLLLSLAGCSGGKPNLGQSPGTSITSKGGSSSNIADLGDLFMLTKGDSSQKYYNTEDGFYYMTEDAAKLKDGSYAYNLFYVDFETRQEIYLCSNSGCQHDIQACTAVLPMDEFEIDSSIFIYQNNLYILSRPYDDDGSSTIMEVGSDSFLESQPAVLYRMELDGSHREKVYSFDSDLTVEASILADESGLYMITKKLEAKQEGKASYMTSSHREVIRLDTSTWKSESLKGMDFGYEDINWKIIGSYGDQFIVEGILFEKALSHEEEMDEDTFLQAYKDSKTVLASFQPSTGKYKELETISNKKLHTVAVDKGIIYLSIEGEDNIVRYNLASGEKDILANIRQNYIFHVFEGMLCTTSWEFVDDYGMNFVDMETGQVSRSDLVTKTLGWRLEIRGETEKDVFLVYDYDAKDGNDDSYEINRHKLALIKKEDLYQGRDNFKSIEMVGKGF